MSWRIHFEDERASARAVIVEAEIRALGCDGAVVFSSRGVRDGSSAAPGALPAGHYGFLARARDENCQWFAQACVERDLPSGTPVDLKLVALDAPELASNCADQTDPELAFDAGAGAISDQEAPRSPGAGEEDGGSHRGNAAPRESVDAGVVRDRARCQDIDGATVACYDFANLSDASSFANHAAADNAEFEFRAGGLAALRPRGVPISVADAPSLNMTEFTIEVWMKADALTNLTGDGDAFSLLLDKDRQYSVGLDALGSPIMTIYRHGDRFEHTTATDIALQVGVTYYLAFSYDGATTRIYVNGHLVKSERVDFPLSTDAQGPLFIGSASPHATRAFDGVIDALRISKLVREPAQICAAATSASTSVSCR